MGEAAQKAQGVEIEIVGSITPEWSFAGGLSYIDDERNGFDNPTTPKFSLNFFTTYDFPDDSQFSKFAVGGGLRASFGRGVDSIRGVDPEDPPEDLGFNGIPETVETINGVAVDQLFDADRNFRVDRLDSGFLDFVLVDLLVSYDVSESLQLQVNARNLFNKYHLQDFGLTTSGAIVGQPRTILGTIDFSF